MATVLAIDITWNPSDPSGVAVLDERDGPLASWQDIWPAMQGHTAIMKPQSGVPSILRFWRRRRETGH